MRVRHHEPIHVFQRDGLHIDQRFAVFGLRIGEIFIARRLGRIGAEQRLS